LKGEEAAVLDRITARRAELDALAEKLSKEIVMGDHVAGQNPRVQPKTLHVVTPSLLSCEYYRPSCGALKALRGKM
jgi:hypothetical protein